MRLRKSFVYLNYYSLKFKKVSLSKSLNRDFTPEKAVCLGQVLCHNTKLYLNLAKLEA